MSRLNQFFSDECRARLRGVVEVFSECADFTVETLVRTPEQAADDFVAKNTIALKDGTFKCPLSGKRFKGPEYVKTHISNKHTAAKDKYVEAVASMNVYMSDPFRIRVLPPVTGGRRLVQQDEFGRDVPAGRVTAPPMMQSPPGMPVARPLRRYGDL
mmetsp:Transcript_15099/g.44870  ORF Transcript_15099/g.44870 Transcript_15099/m.44870 type:complete len:157 (-) Transcript_15099:98-568(-)